MPLSEAVELLLKVSVAAKKTHFRDISHLQVLSKGTSMLSKPTVSYGSYLGTGRKP